MSRSSKASTPTVSPGQMRLPYSESSPLKLLFSIHRGVTLFSADRYHFTDGMDRTLLALRHNIALGDNLALRLQLERSVTDTDRVDEAGLALRYYF